LRKKHKITRFLNQIEKSKNAYIYLYDSKLQKNIKN